MLAALAVVIALAWPTLRLGRAAGAMSLGLYAVFVIVVVISG